MPRLYLALALLGVLFIGGCSQPPYDAAAEGRKLLQRDVEWAQAASDGKDVEKIVSYWSDDAQVIEPGQRVYRGKAAIRAYVTDSLKIPGFKIHWVSETPVFSPDGKMAHTLIQSEAYGPGSFIPGDRHVQIVPGKRLKPCGALSLSSTRGERRTKHLNKTLRSRSATLARTTCEAT